MEENYQISSGSIYHLRKKLGLTQESFALKIGVCISTVNRWENGVTKPNRITSRQLMRLANKHGLF